MIHPPEIGPDRLWGSGPPLETVRAFYITYGTPVPDTYQCQANPALAIYQRIHFVGGGLSCLALPVAGEICLRNMGPENAWQVHNKSVILIIVYILIRYQRFV